MNIYLTTEVYQLIQACFVIKADFYIPPFFVNFNSYCQPKNEQRFGLKRVSLLLGAALKTTLETDVMASFTLAALW